MGKRCGAEVIRRHSTEVIRSFPLCAACTDVEAVSEGAGDSTNFARTVCAAGGCTNVEGGGKEETFRLAEERWTSLSTGLSSTEAPLACEEGDHVRQ